MEPKNVGAPGSIGGLVPVGKGLYLGGGSAVKSGSKVSWLFEASDTAKLAFPIAAMVADGRGGALAAGDAKTAGAVLAMHVARLDRFGHTRWQKAFAPIGMSARTALTEPLATDGRGGFVLLGNANDGLNDFAYLVAGDLVGNTTCAASGKCAKLLPKDCDDGKPCTIDLCDAAKGCTHKPAQNGLVCGGAATCAAGVCK